jgi:XTP/dITP diphosphohydrolase
VQLTFLVTTPRVAPGLMSWSAWQAVASADRVLASDARAPVSRAVSAAGHRVDVLPAAGADDLLAAAVTQDVVWLATDEEATAFPADLAERIVAAEDSPEIEVLHASYDVPGARLLDLVAVMDRLRAECPWDREQTHESLARYLLEETYETLEAIESGDHTHLREELGDLLLQVYFHARIASEGTAEEPTGFDIDDVAGGIVDKLVRRHPHVFARDGDEEAPSLAELDRTWERLKTAEKGRGSVLEGIPLALPALSLAEKTLGRATRVGVEPQPGDGLGDRLLMLVVEARASGLDAEQQLRAAVRRLADAVRAAEE